MRPPRPIPDTRTVEALAVGACIIAWRIGRKAVGA